MSNHTDSPSDLTRRTLLRRTATAGLLALPAAGLLSACVGSSDEPEAPTQYSGTVSAENPLGIATDKPVEIVIFDGGLGTKYATDVHVPSYQAKWPNSKITFSSTQEVSTTLQPRFASNTPPDMVNNAGSKLMDMGALVGAGQVADLTDLFAAASLDIAGKTVKDTLVPGTVEAGTYNGKPYVLNYAYTVFGLWYSGKLFQDNGWTAPTTWAEFDTLAGKMKAKGITPFSYAGANAAYYMYTVILTSAAKIGGPDVLKAIDNLEPGAWTNDAVKQAAKAWGEFAAKYGDKAHLGLKHTEVQLLQNQYKVGFYPSGSWLENEQSKDTPAGFNYQVAALPSVTAADKLPATGLYAAAGEMYFAASKGKHPQGGKEYLRHMLSKAGAKGFTELTKSLTVVQGAAEGLTLSPGLSSANTVLTAAGANNFNFRFDAWYKDLDLEARSATNELMFQGGDADKFVTRIQAAADKIKADSSIPKFSR
ncbi:carbohydrate ABC transporter, N-acetylglucosamine/diacetylchitobiose-binding protein [Catellatospora sp. TT07R-123]|uniref:N-acetylglucosamine/diacetylchitobiose ABC transporter substrate-binding protein n=1 Tax=Catellatospora sp. TT07R-123 TaxID=2733863 RepID=UPI001B2B97F8|nr:N-acetylglucosamine/diacetylchitobiose ABC transporter substrate-binding protein [Catellatospora sp. TT07R-123]GHJ44748.1 carbohydrate ABC transporter, N-acetylglucosamine/diacetylchitobiose-binding protein [Catellatospora sp. TT07R-123]